MLHGTITNPKGTTKKTPEELSLYFPSDSLRMACTLSKARTENSDIRVRTVKSATLKIGDVSLGELNTETKSQNRSHILTYRSEDMKML